MAFGACDAINDPAGRARYAMSYEVGVLGAVVFDCVGEGGVLANNTTRLAGEEAGIPLARSLAGETKNTPGIVADGGTGVSLPAPERCNEGLRLMEVVGGRAPRGPTEDLPKQDAPKNVIRMVRGRGEDGVAVGWLETNPVPYAVLVPVELEIQEPDVRGAVGHLKRNVRVNGVHELKEVVQGCLSMFPNS